VIDGTLRERASAEQILTALEGIAGEAAADGSDTKGSDAKEEPGSDTKEPGSDTKGSGVKAEPEPAGSAKKAGSGSR